MIDQNLDENNADLALIEPNRKKNVDSIIEKWFILQKTIKEELTLEEIISKKQKNDFDQLKKYFKEYYTKKLEIRNVLEEIKILENKDENEVKKINMERELEHVFLDICEPIKNLLFLFRNNYDYIITLISLITEYDEEEKISSLVELFCNQFYENILTNNSEAEELLILIYKLLEKEITPMNFASVDEFLSDDSFLGKFISSFLKRYELKHFLSSLITPFILNLENSRGDDYCGMSLIKINKYIKEKFNSDLLRHEDLKKDFHIENFLFGNITKTSINFKSEEDDDDNEEKEDEDKIENNSFVSWTNIIKENSKEKNYNKEYKNMLDLDYLDDKIIKENDDELKNFYLYELEQITNDPDKFSNRTLLELFKEKDFRDNQRLLAKIYKDNFNFIKNQVDYFIQILIDQVDMMPYSIRCICKFISLLLKQKFPLLLDYFRNSFIGKFIFDKCIFPVLCLENKNALEPRILSKDTKKCLMDIISILNHANKCLLFNNILDTEKTIFNHYLIEIIPLLNKFYEKVIDVDLPPIVENLLLNSKINTGANNLFISNKRKNKETLQSDSSSIKTKENKPVFNYFKEHKEEILHLQCICFSLDDILFILSLIGRNLKAFKDLPDYIFFERTYEFIQPSDYKLDQENSRHPDTKNFFIIYKDEKNNILKDYMKEKKKNSLAFNPDEEDPTSMNKKFKFCIKTILKGLNYLNTRDYAYLNMAINSRKFFTALKYILEESGEFSQLKNRIPLKWYGQYLYNNRDNIEEKYKYEDYLELYNEIYKEESDILNKLKTLISIIITRNRINISCAEQNIEIAKKELNHIKQMKEYLKIEKFINEEDIEICIQTNELSNVKMPEKKRTFSIFFKKEKELEIDEPKLKIPLLISDDLNCPHNLYNKSNDVNENDNIDKKIQYHAYNINDFITKFGEHPWKEDKLVKYEKPRNLLLSDIKNGNQNNEIYRSLKMYLEIIKKHLKQPNCGINFFENADDATEFDILETIKDYIIWQIYKYVHQVQPSEEDFNVHNKTKRLQWITPKHLNIKDINILHLNSAILWIKRFEFYKSMKDKMHCISKIYTDMSNAIKFGYGINTEVKKEDLKPLFTYIIIQAQPERIVSNIYYIKCFSDYMEVNENISYLLILLESIKEFIINISYKFLNITKEEFDNNMRYGIKK